MILSSSQTVISSLVTSHKNVEIYAKSVISKSTWSNQGNDVQGEGIWMENMDNNVKVSRSLCIRLTMERSLGREERSR